MKAFKIYFISLFLGSTLFASGNELFTYDKALMEAELASLSQLEKRINENSGLTMSSLLAVNSNSGDNGNFCLPNEFKGMLQPPLGIYSFIWGCCFGPTGMMVVYMVTQEDHEETMKAFNGCLVFAFVLIVLYTLYYYLLFTLTAGY